MERGRQIIGMLLILVSIGALVTWGEVGARTGFCTMKSWF